MATRAEIRALIRERADGENDDDFVTDTELNGWIELARRELYGLLADYDMLPSYEYATITANGSERYGLADDVFQVVGVYLEQHREWVPLDRLSPKVMIHADDTGTPTHYQADKVHGLSFWPVPTSGTLRYRYAKKLDNIAAEGDTAADDVELDYVNGWEEYIVVWCTIKYKQKEDIDWRVFKDDLEGIKRRIMDEADARERTESACIEYDRSENRVHPSSRRDYRPVRWID